VSLFRKVSEQLLLAAMIVLAASPALAQRASDNAVSSAQDAFGTTVGDETIGLYDTRNARGFNPMSAGNVRIEGMYFDRPSSGPGEVIIDRLMQGSTVRVGIGAQSYPFPAPTGIVDLRLRLPGDELLISPFISYGPYNQASVEVDSQIPLVPGKLSMSLGGRWKHVEENNGTDAEDWSAAAIFRWRPTDNIEVIPFWGRAVRADWEASPWIFMQGSVLPPKIERRLNYAQDWALFKQTDTNFGVITRVVPWKDWTVRAAIFRAHYFRPIGHLTFYSNTTADGISDISHLSSPPQRYSSYSGELRVSRVFGEGPRRHTIHLTARGRQGKRLFGGTDVVSGGSGVIGVQAPIPEPNFVFDERGTDDSSQWTGGAVYEGQWPGVGSISLGLQKAYYDREVVTPGLPVSLSDSRPWLYNGSLSIYANKALTFYGSYTRGLEESGVATQQASNRGEAQPASLTEQIDAGFRYTVMPGVQFVAGAFEIKKPYFERDSSNIFRRLGTLRHRGVELSLAGQVIDGMSVVAGVVLLQARVSGELVDQGAIGNIPIGAKPRVSRLDVEYGPKEWKGLSVDVRLENIKQGFADTANSLKLKGYTTLNLGARYRFEISDVPATLRLRVQNVTNTYAWELQGGNNLFLSYIGERRYSVSVAADF
jgi:iron complex outermembrane recepter protein